MRSITRHLELPLGAQTTFALLHTPSAIRMWWSAEHVIVVPALAGLWVATWGKDEDAPDYVTAARILVWEPPRTLRLKEFQYFTRDGARLPFVASLETEFSVQATDTGTVLVVRQTGFPEDAVADAFFSACEQGWTTTLDGVRCYADNLLASQTTQPLQ